jgi:hypothetical protein
MTASATITKEQFREFALWFCSTDEHVRTWREWWLGLIERAGDMSDHEKAEETKRVREVMRAKDALVQHLVARLEAQKVDTTRRGCLPLWLGGNRLVEYALLSNNDIAPLVWCAQLFERFDPKVTELLRAYGRALCHWNSNRLKTLARCSPLYNCI